MCFDVIADSASQPVLVNGLVIALRFWALEVLVGHTRVCNRMPN